MNLFYLDFLHHLDSRPVRNLLPPRLLFLASPKLQKSLRKAYDARDDLMYEDEECSEEEAHDEEPLEDKVRLTPAEKDREFGRSEGLWREKGPFKVSTQE